MLPRQTCGLFTHTVYVSDYKSGLADLEENFKGGELFLTVLYSPVSDLFMEVNWEPQVLLLECEPVWPSGKVLGW